MSLSVKDALHKRISTRAFLDKPVSEADIRALLEDARFAASGGNLQPWKVVVTTGEALTMLTAPERAFFWGYAMLTALFVALILWLAWRVLLTRRRHPLPRREVTWT